MSVPVEPPVRGRPRDPKRRDAILRAAIELISDVGYDRTTVEAIASRAGVSKPTIYRRWPGGKKEIVIDAIRLKHEAADTPDQGSLRADLLALLQTMVEHLHEDTHLAGGLISQLRDSEELSALMRDEVVTHERRRVGRLLDRAVERGELSPEGRITPLFHDIAGSLIFTRAVISGEPLDGAFLNELVDHVLLPVLPLLPKDK
jgi:AcrR family transcriptional regulator